MIGSNFALVATLNETILVKTPDWFYVPQVQPVAPGTIRRSYTPYLEGEPVAIVMEFLSVDDCGELSLRSTPPYGKLYFYEQILQVPTYVTYDPYDLALQVRTLENGRYILQDADANGRYWIPELHYFWGFGPVNGCVRTATGSAGGIRRGRCCSGVLSRLNGKANARTC